MQGCEANNDPEKAILLLNEALKCNPVHSAASVALAKIHLARFVPNFTADVIGFEGCLVLRPSVLLRF